MIIILNFYEINIDIVSKQKLKECTNFLEIFYLNGFIQS